MANRFETGIHVEAEENPLQRHRDKFYSGVLAVQNKHERLVFSNGYTRSLTRNNLTLSVDVATGCSDFLIQKEERDFDRNPLYQKNIAISLGKKDELVSITQVTRQPSGRIEREMTLEYGNINEAGDVALLDGQYIEASYNGEDGAYTYSAMGKNFDWIRGVELAVTHEDNTLVIREDPDSKGFNFPLKTNIYDELRDAERVLNTL